ncbi:MAG: stage IV sporulation protein A [Clostridia bacterium]
MDNFDLYQDIAMRTNGDIYIGVVGPVRTGKSTFITKFMETMVLPNISDKNHLKRIVDEMPQSADGKTIMTTQPKFVPDDGVSISVSDGVKLKVRLIDCVGYLVSGAEGHKEGDKSRLVKTPWSNEEMSFEKAAEIGTEKVIKEHSTIGVLVTTDGSITDLQRHNYINAEERVVKELKEIGKPFVVVMNTANEKNDDTIKLCQSLTEKYGAPVLPINILKLNEQGINQILQSALMEFPIEKINVKMPKWMQCLAFDNQYINGIYGDLADTIADFEKMYDYKKLLHFYAKNDIMEKEADVDVVFGKGEITLTLHPKQSLYYKILSEQCGMDIDDDYKLIGYLKQLKDSQVKYQKLKLALQQVDENGYGVVIPTNEDMILEEPVMVKHGGKFGLKLKAKAPSLHIMKIDVETEISPFGAQTQSEEMINYLMNEFEDNKQGIWDTNMFGKSLNTLMKESMDTKVNSMPEEVRNKMRKTASRIVNEGRGGVLCVLL